MAMHLYQVSSMLIENTVGKMSDNLTSVVLAVSVITLTLGYISKLVLKQSQSSSEEHKKYPPYIPSSIPFLGHAIAFGKSPIEFLENAYEKVRIQYCCKVYLIYFSAQSATYFVYKTCSNKLHSLYNNLFHIIQLLNLYLTGVGLNYYCIHSAGKNRLSFLYRRRDRAHREIKNIFYKVTQKRRSSGEKVDDMLQTLIDATYKDGRPLNDDEIAGMLIGLLLAGQHTSSTTSSWLGFFLKTACGEDLPPLNFDQLKDLTLLDRCLKETLRLRPPIMTMMRMARSPQTVAGYTIPAGHQVCVSPTVNHRLQDTWTERMEFRPDRYLNDNPAAGEKFAYVPFGAGRHRCIGENFAYVQIKTIWSTMLRLYEFNLVDGYFPTINYTTMIHTPHNPVIRYKRRQH
uniref:Lanosterol 14-alpha demethylase n=1 Tax=Oncorhynchus tshawytscha TaxID=74940 RepID=A0A8C8MFR0_ONCTS